MSEKHHSTRVVTITPERAAAMLRRQELLVAQDPEMRQRNVKEKKVQMYSRDMAAGEWECNGETLIFASNGRILDGMHRLLACVEAGKPFRTHIVEGVAHTAMRTIDTGIGRTMGDQLTIAGKPTGTRLATALGVLWRWEQTGHRGFDWNARPTRLEMFEVLTKHPDIEKFCARSGRLEQLMSTGLGSALWYIFARQDAELADVFFEAVISGASLREDDPVFVLRERLLRDRQQAAVRRVRLNLTMDVTADRIYRAWDATRRGLKISKLQRGKRGTDEVLLTRRVSHGKKVVGIEEGSK